MGKRIDSQKLRRREQRRNENGGWRTLLADFAQKLGVKLKRVKRPPAAGRALRDAGAV